jgi:hypothetical protein
MLTLIFNQLKHNKMVALQTKTMFDEIHMDEYPFYLAFSSDTLVVLDEERFLVESILQGVDKDGILCVAENEDKFLEAITVIKEMISMGLNPINYFKTK